MEFPLALTQRLDRAEGMGRRRELSLRRGVDFSSNDYLGFSEDPELHRRARDRVSDLPTGAAGSRLLRGNLPLFEAIERRLAGFCGRESALLFPSGYQANVGLLSALLSEGDVVFSDQLNHASIVDGIRLGRAEKRVFPHNDLKTLERELASVSRAEGIRVIVTESLFSMEGDFAPLEALAEIASRHSALLVVDESHATGLYGDFEKNLGGGRVQSLGLGSEIFATLHTGGKALGVSGAWVCGPALLRDYLVNFSRAFIFSTAMSPWAAALLDAAIEHWSCVGRDRASRVHDLARSLSPGLRAATSPILSIPFGESHRALEASRRLIEQGFDVRAIRPPTVAEGSSRLRVTVNAKLTQAQVEDFRACLSRVLS